MTARATTTVTPSSYCLIGDPMQYSTSIMTNPALRKNVQHGLTGFIRQATHATLPATLPAVTFLKPGDDDGHPGYSTLAAFENQPRRPGHLRRAEQPEGVEVDRDLHHVRRVRRLLRLRVHPAGQLLR
jgi:hypothetical protein